MDLFRILDTTPEPPIVRLATAANSSGDYALPVPMTAYQQELTDQVVSLHYADILKYFETDAKDQLLLDSLETLYLNAQLVATHPYLLVSHLMPKPLTAKDVPQLLCNTSGKFQVLRDLLVLVEDTHLEVALVARNDGRLLDLLEALLLGRRCSIHRHAGNHIRDPAKNKSGSSSGLAVHLIAADTTPGALISKTKTKLSFDLVLAFDITPIDSLLQSLKKLPKTPIVRFVSANSIDHAAMYFSNIIKNRTREYLVNVTAAVVVLRDRVGVLPPDLRPVYAHGLSYLKDWLTDPEEKPWPLPEMSPIKVFDASDVEKSLLTEVVYEKPIAHSESKPYYDTKRLRKDYSTNPLNDTNFGILSINSKYNDTLTHKLIQQLNSLHCDLNLQFQEFEHFRQLTLNPKTENYLLEDGTKLKTEVDHTAERIKAANIRSEKIFAVLEEIKATNRDLESEVENKLSLSNPKLKEIEELKSQILRQESRKDSLSTEIEYMSKEIMKAKASIQDSDSAITSTLPEISTKQESLLRYFDDFENIGTPSDKVIEELLRKTYNVKLLIDDSLRKLQSNRARNEGRRISPSIK